ncbi:MAG: redoxin domain-containing protein [Armatimonadetes bacterium]|nr:redoxin domain-containing protein [Armatimonadota bacterium]
MTVLLSGIALAQDKPEQIARKDLPKDAVATYCGASGAQENERPNAGYRYKGKAYYFCDKPAIDAFLKDPESFLGPAVPFPMPGFELKELAGKVWNADTMKGKVVLVDFWASWCKPCIAMMPTIDKLRDKYVESGFEVLSVSIDEKPADFAKFVKGHEFCNPVLLDTAKTYEKWRVASIPAMFLVKDGKVIAKWVGKQEEKTLAEAIRSALGQ